MNNERPIDEPGHTHPGTGLRVTKHSIDGVTVWLYGYLAHLSRRQSQLQGAAFTVLSEPPNPTPSRDYWQARIKFESVINTRHLGGLSVEIAFGSDDDRGSVFGELSKILPAEQAEVVTRIVNERIDAQSYPAHLRRPTPSVGTDWLGGDLKSTEIYVPTVPFRGYETTPTRDAFYRQRILRLIRSDNLALWHWSKPIREYWSPEIDDSFRGIPRISTATLTANIFDQATERRVIDVIAHIDYCIESLGASISQWQSGVMEAIAKGGAVFEISEFDTLRTELGRIGSAAGMAESSLVANTYRAREDHRILGLAWIDFLKQWRVTSDQLHDRQTDMATLLASLASGLQVLSSNKLSDRFGLVAAAVLLPSLVLAFFGGNLAILSEGANGQLAQVLLWCAIAVTVSSIFLVQQVDRYWAVTLALAGIMTISVFLAWAHRLNGDTLVPMVLWALALITLGLVGLQRSQTAGKGQ